MPVEARQHRAIRIGVCGSASVGKTTLAGALGRELGVPCLQEEMRAYLEHSRRILADLPAPELEGIVMRLWREREEKERTVPAFVADNCAIDFAAYALYYGCLSAASEQALLTTAASYLRRYDAVFLLPWGVLPYEQDGVRPPDPYLQLRYQLLLEGLLRRYVDPERLHLLPETLLRLQDRISWARSKITHLLESRSCLPKGRVYLVGAGPGDPKLLTMRAFELLEQADVVAYDLLISPELIARIPARAELLAVGRRDGMGPTTYRLHPAVLQRAKAGKTVVRLKSGDPLLFGRGGEEAEDLRNAGIPFEIVPGITAALGAASYAGIPLTQRGEASQVLLGAGHEPEKWPSGSEEDLQQRTTVLYMAARRLSANLNRLQAEGYAAETPAALVMSATTARQRVVSGTLGTLAQLVPALDPEIPAILLVGRVVARRRYVAWFEPEQPRDFDTSSSEERPDSSEMSTEHGGALREAATGSTR
jgi:uroporphyrin-III C-methyltransferase